MRSFMRNLVAMRQMKTKLRCLKPHRPNTVDFPIDARERVKELNVCFGLEVDNDIEGVEPGVLMSAGCSNVGHLKIEGVSFGRI